MQLRKRLGKVNCRESCFRRSCGVLSAFVVEVGWTLEVTGLRERPFPNKEFIPVVLFTLYCAHIVCARIRSHEKQGKCIRWFGIDERSPAPLPGERIIHTRLRSQTKRVITHICFVTLGAALPNSSFSKIRFSVQKQNCG